MIYTINTDSIVINMLEVGSDRKISTSGIRESRMNSVTTLVDYNIGHQ